MAAAVWVGKLAILVAGVAACSASGQPINGDAGGVMRHLG
jgi:hypothetical protein